MDGLMRALSQVRRELSPRLVLLEEPVGATRVALLSSSFDPLTIGHVALASAASASAQLTLLVYSPRTLPKEGEPEPPLLTELDRLEVVRRYCASRPWAVPAVSSHGLLAEQVEAARRGFPGAAVDLVVGSDKVIQLLDPRWYEDRDRALGDLLSGSTVRYAVRAGDEGRVEAELGRPENRAFAGAFEQLRVDPGSAAVSARDVRGRARRGQRFEHLVPPESVDAVRRALER